MQHTTQPSPTLPSKEQITAFPLFQSLPASAVYSIKTADECKAVAAALEHAVVLGFDTESKPTFKVGEVSTGPHIIQLATASHAYLFYVNTETWAFLKPILENKQQLKVGFGLKNDRALFRKKGIQLEGIVDLSKAFSGFGLKQTMGIKNAMALLFQVHFIKSKKMSTSNWSVKQLSAAQIAYAAADAYGCVVIYQKLIHLGLVQPQS